MRLLPVPPDMLLLVLLPTARVVLLFLRLPACRSREAATCCGTDVATRCRLRSAISCASGESVCSSSITTLLTQYSGHRSAICDTNSCKGTTTQRIRSKLVKLYTVLLRQLLHSHRCAMHALAG
jgi:hypothetical protein